MLEGWEENITDRKKPFGRLTKSVYVMDTLKQRNFLTPINIANMAKSKEKATFADANDARAQKMKTTGTFHMYIA
jgi:hypothetical protein